MRIAFRVATLAALFVAAATAAPSTPRTAARRKSRGRSRAEPRTMLAVTIVTGRPTTCSSTSTTGCSTAIEDLQAQADARDRVEDRQRDEWEFKLRAA